MRISRGPDSPIQHRQRHKDGSPPNLCGSAAPAASHHTASRPRSLQTHQACFPELRSALMPCDPPALSPSPKNAQNGTKSSPQCPIEPREHPPETADADPQNKRKPFKQNILRTRAQSSSRPKCPKTAFPLGHFGTFGASKERTKPSLRKCQTNPPRPNQHKQQDLYRWLHQCPFSPRKAGGWRCRGFTFVRPIRAL